MGVYDDPVQRQILQEWQWYRYACSRDGTREMTYSAWLDKRSATPYTTKTTPKPNPEISQPTRVDSLEPEQGDNQPAKTEVAFSLRLADHCRHVVHPGNKGANMIICCTCEVNSILKELKTLSDVWEKNGGPNAHYHTRHNPYYQTILRAWHDQKLRLVKTTRYLEDGAEQERAWEIDKPGLLDNRRSNIQSSEAAVILARKETPFLHWLDTDFAPSTPQPAGDKKKRKTVSFGEAVVENPHRPRLKYNRGFEEYRPGRWASQDSEGFLNTSFYRVEGFGTSEFERQLDGIWEVNHPSYDKHNHDVTLQKSKLNHLAPAGMSVLCKLQSLEERVREEIIGCIMFLLMLVMIGVWLIKGQMSRAKVSRKP